MVSVPLSCLFLVLCGLCTSVMWGGIFNMAVEGLYLNGKFFGINLPANIVMDVEGHSETALVERGQFFIYKDGDGLARKEEDGE